MMDRARRIAAAQAVVSLVTVEVTGAKAGVHDVFGPFGRESLELMGDVVSVLTSLYAGQLMRMADGDPEKVVAFVRAAGVLLAAEESA